VTELAVEESCPWREKNTPFGAFSSPSCLFWDEEVSFDVPADVSCLFAEHVELSAVGGEGVGLGARVLTSANRMAPARSAIRGAAARVPGRRPDAAMAEIADDAGVGRATLYRHFPTRESLPQSVAGSCRRNGP
jgi:hypothetical protein